MGSGNELSLSSSPKDCQHSLLTHILHSNHSPNDYNCNFTSSICQCDLKIAKRRLPGPPAPADPCDAYPDCGECGYKECEWNVGTNSCITTAAIPEFQFDFLEECRAETDKFCSPAGFTESDMSTSIISMEMSPGPSNE